MKLTDDYKNIVKLRFENPVDLGSSFFDSLYAGIENPSDFDSSYFNDLHLAVILNYLKKSHTEYLTFWFPKIESFAKDIQNELGVNELTMTLHSFVVNYYNELSNHINFEEKVLYNFVEKLLKGSYVEQQKVFVLNHFLETHSHAVSDDLGTIKKVLLNLNADFLENKTAIMLFDHLSIVQNDLMLHGVIEDEILIDKIHQYISLKY